MGDALAYFQDNYDPIYVFQPSSRNVYLGEKDKRICRFCSRTVPEISFQSDSHALPAVIGERRLLTYYECDSCNNSYSKMLEDHFDKFLGIWRTVGLIKGRSGVPSYKTAAKKTRIDFANGVLDIRNAVDDSIVKMVPEQNELVITGTRQPYIPCAVYKCLCKIAMLLMPEEEMPFFQETIRWFSQEDHNSALPRFGPLIALFSFTPGMNPYQKTMALLWRRKTAADETKYPYMIFVLAFHNFVFQIVIPSYQRDAGINRKDINIFFFPTPFTLPSPFSKWFASQYGNTIRTVLDLSATDVVVGEKEVVTMKFDGFSQRPNK